MSKPRSKSNQKPVVMHRYIEVNIARLGLISVQRQISPDFVSWTQTSEFDDGPVEVRCTAHQDYGVPHGIDSDIFSAILHLYMTKGASEDGRVSCTIYEILKTAGIFMNARTYAQVKESLDRLLLSQYFISKGWRDHERKRWTTVSLRHIENIAYTANEEHNLDSATIMVIGLPDTITHSIRAGYNLPLEDALLRDMAQPTTRSLYRLLEAQRRDPLDPTRMENTLTCNLLEWAETCKLYNTDTPDRIRRSLDGAHEELIRVGYLSKVEYEGRGKKQILTYHFSTSAAVVAPPELVEALIQHGIAPGVARRLAAQYPERIRPAIKHLENMINSSYPIHNKPGLLFKMVQNIDDYLPIQDPLPTPQPASKVTEVKEPIADVLGSLEDNINSTLMLLQTICKLTPKQQDILRSSLLQGLLNADEFGKKVSKHFYLKEWDEIKLLVQQQLESLSTRDSG